MSATDGLCAGLGEAKVFHFARLNKVFDGPGGLFDGRVGVDAMLVEQVDSVGL